MKVMVRAAGLKTWNGSKAVFPEVGDIIEQPKEVAKINIAKGLVAPVPEDVLSDEEPESTEPEDLEEEIEEEGEEVSVKMKLKKKKVGKKKVKKVVKKKDTKEKTKKSIKKKKKKKTPV